MLETSGLVCQVFFVFFFASDLKTTVTTSQVVAELFYMLQTDSYLRVSLNEFFCLAAEAEAEFLPAV